MMNKIVFLLLVTFLPFVYAGNFSLQKGVGVNNTNLHELAQTSWEYAKSSTTQKKYDDGFAVAFLRVAGLTDLYSLSGSNKLYLTNFDTRDVLGNWPLTPWAYLSPPPELIAQAEEYDTIVDDFAGSLGYQVGCLSTAPLRYGDFDKDGRSELVLFIGNTLTVFSPDYGRTIFSTWLSLNDWLTAEDSLEYYLEEDFSVNKKPENPQYESRIAHKRYYQSVHVPGYRGYSKIYIDDFNKDGNTDILVWKKIYLSKLEKDPQRGFDLVRDEFAHYSRDLTAQQKSEAGVTGEYLPQDTRPETIQNWLSAKNLTWQKGFPSKSECAGEEGKLIPEMHDTLLNDPDVLK